MKHAILAATLIASFVTVPVQGAHAEEGGRFSLETGMDYNTGKYGGTQSTEIRYVPVTGKYQGKSWTLKLTVPYLQITGPDNVITGVGVTGTATGTRSTRSGLGDMIVAATNNVYYGGPAGLIVNLTGKVKLGTASSNGGYGLGTGKNDYSFQSDLFQVTEDFTTFGSLGYKFLGSPAGYTLNNIFYGSLGGSYKFTQETSGGLMFNLGQKTSATGSPHQEAILFVSQKLSKDWKAQGYVLQGFTNAVPDFGAGATVAYLF